MDKKKTLEREITETQAAQIELDKTAEDFKNLHKERQVEGMDTVRVMGDLMGPSVACSRLFLPTPDTIEGDARLETRIWSHLGRRGPDRNVLGTFLRYKPLCGFQD